MKSCWIRWMYAGVSLLLAAGCAPKNELLDAVIRQEIAAGRVQKVKLYVDAQGAVVKRTLYVTRSAIPDWVIQLADEKIGRGPLESYELEWYSDAPNLKVYEVTRRIGGRKVEISVNEHRQVRYMERGITASALPAAVRAAVASNAGFKPMDYEHKQGADFEEYQVEGMLAGAETIFTYHPDGSLLKKQTSLAGEFQIAMP